MVDLKRWYQKLTEKGPQYGYIPNPGKTYLITKQGINTKCFEDTGIGITAEGLMYLGVPLGAREYEEKKSAEKI